MLLWARCALSAARLAAGDVGAALEHAEEAAASGVAADFHAAGQPAWALGAALAAAGERDGGGALRAEADGRSRPTGPALAADLAEARAAGEASRGGTSVAATRPGAARGRARLAAAPRARSPRGRAAADRGAHRAPRRRSTPSARSAGATRRCASCGGSATASARVPPPQPTATLTAREREIAELVAAGRTNREVAAQLVLSERTIEAHLRNVYAKLGVRSRVELTRRLTE